MQIIFYQHHFLKRKHKCERKLNDNDIESITLRKKKLQKLHKNYTTEIVNFITFVTILQYFSFLITFGDLARPRALALKCCVTSVLHIRQLFYDILLCRIQLTPALRKKRSYSELFWSVFSRIHHISL